MKYRHGVVIGKFLPPHRGHKLLVDTGTHECDRLTVIICAKPTDPIPGELRAAWLREIHPKVEVMLIDDHYDENDSQVWAENTIRWIGHTPDVAFSSEDYGDRYAEFMHCRHVMVDRHRLMIPVSGTAIRANPYANWEFLEAPVRAFYCKRVCVVGAESTGTTTLASALAQHYRTPWIAEYGRTYSEKKMASGDMSWTSDEFVHIAEEHARQEDAAAREAKHVLISDTNAFATVLWHRRYMGTDEPRVAAIAAARHVDLYLLTGDEIPFVQDGYRDGEHIRHQMHMWFEDALRAQSVPWLPLRGSHEQRMSVAVAAIDELLRLSPSHAAKIL